MYLFDQDLIRMTFIVGIVVSVWLYEKTHTTTGSLVVPGYVGAQLLNPLALIATAVNAVITYYLVAVVLPRYAAVYGRARFVVNILVSIVITLLMGPVLGAVTGPSIPLLDTIGYVIPALIAYDMNRQGPKKTATAVLISGALAATPALLLVLMNPGRVEPQLPVDTGLLAVGDVWFPIVALTSTLVSATLHHNHRLRSGGFVGSMYLGLAAVRPEQLVYFVGMAIVIYVVVHVGMKRVMILFGRRKFAVMLALGSLLSWMALGVVGSWVPGGLGIATLPVAALFVPALLANDMERTSAPDVLIGGLIAAGSTLSVTLVLAGVVDRMPIPAWAVPLLVLSLSALLWPQLVAAVETGASRIRDLVRAVPVPITATIERTFVSATPIPGAPVGVTSDALLDAAMLAIDTRGASGAMADSEPTRIAHLFDEHLADELDIAWLEPLAPYGAVSTSHDAPTPAHLTRDDIDLGVPHPIDHHLIDQHLADHLDVAWLEPLAPFSTITSQDAPTPAHHLTHLDIDLGIPHLIDQHLIDEHLEIAWLEALAPYSAVSAAHGSPTSAHHPTRDDIDLGIPHLIDQHLDRHHADELDIAWLEPLAPCRAVSTSHDAPTTAHHLIRDDIDLGIPHLIDQHHDRHHADELDIAWLEPVASHGTVSDRDLDEAAATADDLIRDDLDVSLSAPQRADGHLDIARLDALAPHRSVFTCDVGAPRTSFDDPIGDDIGPSLDDELAALLLFDGEDDASDHDAMSTASSDRQRASTAHDRELCPAPLTVERR